MTLRSKAKPLSILREREIMSDDVIAHRLAGWAPVGDWVFKVGFVCLSGVVFTKEVGSVTHWLGSFGEVPSVWNGLLILLSGISVLPLFLGVLWRRIWARRLFLLLLVMHFFHGILFDYWHYGPFSELNSLFHRIYLLIGLLLMIWVVTGRWARRYLNQPGRKQWFWIGLIAPSLLMAGSLVFICVFYGISIFSVVIQFEWCFPQGL